VVEQRLEQVVEGARGKGKWKVKIIVVSLFTPTLSLPHLRGRGTKYSRGELK
jgi:hypothetical protein